MSGCVFFLPPPYILPQIKTRLPNHFSALTAIYQELPYYQDLLSYPFTNLVVNLGAETNGHIDSQDDELCVTLPFGCWKGGELSFYELGIVLELRPGDVVIFPSNRITHFNLWMEGFRGSIVLSTDSRMKGWIDGRNGWSSWVR